MVTLKKGSYRPLASSMRFMSEQSGKEEILKIGMRINYAEGGYCKFFHCAFQLKL